ncbi:MAG: nitrous oxide reductase accessory protein NosL [Anaerolineae bacterium]|nr:nitrous oxide reductase accessory protein NosL [Anaerolineae bacterium]
MRAWRWRGWVVMVLAALALAGCSPRQAGEPQPPEIVYGRDVCDRCGMIMDEPRFAAAVVLADGQTLKYDDLGEMLLQHGTAARETVRAWFVHDYHSEQWVRGEKALYVISPKLRTPMGFGVAAFAERPDAEAFAATMSGTVLSLEEARGKVKGGHP